MEYDYSEERRLISESIEKTMVDFEPSYWREKDEEKAYPQEFWDRLAEGGWLGLMIPEEYDGFEGSLREVITFAKSTAKTGACYGGTFLTIIHFLDSLAITRNGTKAQKDKYLPRLAAGELHTAFALTEPETGFDTLSMTTKGRREGDEWVIEGEKTYITGAGRADLFLLVARTTPLDSVSKKSEGLTMFLVDTESDDVNIDIDPFDKMALNYVDTSHVYIDEIRVPESGVLGEVDGAWVPLLELLNPERLIAAATSIGAGEYVLDAAVDYATQREVFGRPIGENQGIQFPLAETKIHLEAADVLTEKAAWLYDTNQACGFEANAANYLASEWGLESAHRAIQTFGGSGFMRDTEIERFWRELRLRELAPASQEMILNYVGNHVLNLPKSY